MAGLALAVMPASASAKPILVFGPHDDEIFLAAGIARAAHARGDTVKMILVTNGDVNGVSVGLARFLKDEAVAPHLNFRASSVHHSTGRYFGGPDSAARPARSSPLTL